MATQIVLATPADFSASRIGVIPPTLAGLKSYAYFGNAVNDNVNIAPGGAVFTDVGAGPSLFPGYAHFVSGVSALNTGQVDVVGLLPRSIIFAARAPSGLVATIGGTRDFTGTSAGFFIQLVAGAYSGQIQTTATKSNSIWSFAPGGGVTSFFRLFAVTMQMGSPLVAYDLSAGGSTNTSAGNTSSNPYVPNTGQPFQIGSTPTVTTGANGADIAFWADWAAYLSSSDINGQVPAIRATLAQRGITV